MANRVTFLVDGFNLYHSLKGAMRETDKGELRWLDLHSLFASYLHLLGTEADLEEIYYFTAYAKHLLDRKPDVVNRHRTYVEALQSRDIEIKVASFKEKTRWCPECNATFSKFEEKETDVHIATKLLSLLHQDACDTAVVVSGDTDLAPAMRVAGEVFEAKSVCAAFPWGRANKELKPLADFYFSMSADQYERHQLPNPVELSSGRMLHRPDYWGESD